MNGNCRELLYSVFKVKMLLRLNRLARSADEHVANQRPGISEGDWKAIERDVVSKLACQERDRIVEIGCGTGLLGEVIADHVRFYVGFDLIQKLLQRAKTRNRSRHACFILADGKALPVRGASIDRVLVYSVILFLPPIILRFLLRECYRILKPHGLMLLGDIPNPDQAMNFLAKKQVEKDDVPLFLQLRLSLFMAKKRLQRMLNMPGAGWYRPWDVMKILSEEGFDCRYAEQGMHLPFGHYRYDCLASRRGE